jgi:hypothetical protein
MKAMKILALFILILSIFFLTALPNAQAATNESLSLTGIQFFPEDHIWNVPVDTLPVDPNSAIYIEGINRFAKNLGYNNKMPINIVDSSVSHKSVIFRSTYSTDPGPYPIPDNPLIQGGPDISVPGDHHMLIVDRDESILYELYNPIVQQNGTWSAYSGAVFNLSNYSLRPEGHSSADAAGLPMVPGILRYDELMSGEVHHALRISVWITNNSYVWPARNKASAISNGTFPPMGQRIRLKSTFDTSGYPPQSKAILEVLKKYGAMVADNGALFRVYMQPDSRWTDSDIKQLNTVLTTNFEAVDVSSMMIDPDSGQANILPIVIPEKMNTINLSQKQGEHDNKTMSFPFNIFDIIKHAFSVFK